MKCEKCRERVERAKYITHVTCSKAGEVGKRYGMFYIPVGPDYIGKKYRVIIEEVPNAGS